MSGIAKAESALVEKLEIARTQKNALYAKSPTLNKGNSPDSKKSTVRPPQPPITDGEDEVRTVLNLEVPMFDKTRTFQGIEKQKIAKKDRHIKALDTFAKTLEDVAENIEVEVLKSSRAVREDLEKIDDELKAACDLLAQDDHLVEQSSEDLDTALDNLKSVISKRSSTIESFGSTLESLECGRADRVGTEIKLLVDNLIAIAHKLPDDIEHIVEAEAFDLNTVLTTNRKSHAELLGVMRTKQVEVEVCTLHKWEVAKKQWRLLRHQKAIRIFHYDIQSKDYTEPSDRQQFMSKVRQYQLERHACREKALEDLAALNADTIKSEEVARVQQALVALNEEELNATQECYNGLSQLRANLRGIAETRMEELRKELHVYGALHDEPPLHEIAANLRTAVGDPELSELWRLGGGLKAEIASIASDICSDNIVYENLVASVQSRLEVVVCGFTLKEVLNERGRLPRLDNVRALLTKVKTVPRADVAGILASLLPDLKEMSSFEKMPYVFQNNLSICAEGIEKELQRLAEYDETGLGTKSPADISTAKSTRRTARSMRQATADAMEKNSCADPLLVKQWSKVLGMLYYGSDIPDNYKEECCRCLDAVRQQRTCNDYVDVVIRDECDYELDRLDSRYKRLIDAIATFLELQTGSLSFSSNKITAFYIKIAKIVEDHKKHQNDLDEQSLDALWDFKEENRLAKEDREAEFEEACRALRRSADMADLQKNFDLVLAKLAEILESYRVYHGEACFLADKHPISLADDYVDHMGVLCEMFEMEPITPHRILDEQTRLHEQNKRLNKKYLEHPKPEPAVETKEDNADDEEHAADTGDDNGESAPAENVDPEDADKESRNVPTTPDPIEKEHKFYAETFYVDQDAEPTEDEEDSYDEDEARPDPSLGRKYGLMKPFSDFVVTFVEEVAVEGEEDDDDGEVVMTIQPSLSEENLDGDGISAPIQHVTDRVNSDYPWIVMKSYPNVEDPPMVTLLPDDALEKMDFDEICAYEESVEKYFVPRNGDEPFEDVFDDAGEHDTGEGNEKDEENSPRRPRITAEEQKVAYEKTVQIAERVRKRRQEQTPKYLRENPPCDSEGNPFACMVEIEYDVVHVMLYNLRESLVNHLEVTSSDRIEKAEILNKKRKEELTEELEDLLRTHWPRCGLVETRIKRPREVELLNHEEKTYRFILSIQEKMSALHAKFDDEVSSSEQCCSEYIDNIHALVKQLTDIQFKTLAALQGVEVKARALTQSFTAASGNHLSNLRQMVAEDASGIVIYARDFRKICPPQEEGKEGGYSPDELNDIAALVEGQCAEIDDVLQEWMGIINDLEQKFTVTQAEHGSFTNKYDDVANELALSQGLGQKYGAPRRRAQERLRTEMARDDQAAGKVDELIANLEFRCAEAVRKSEAASTQMTPSLISSLVQGKEASLSKALREGGYDELRAVEEMWNLTLKVRKSLHDRAKYLVVFMNPDDESVPDITWPPVQSRLPPLASSDDRDDRRVTETILPMVCLQDVVDEVERSCKEETKELYVREGKESILQETEEGIPESLSIWLRETRHKILGPKGHREKSWKRLWNQVDTFEVLLARKTGPLDQPQTKVGVPAACFRTMSLGYEMFTAQVIDRKVEQFAKLVRLWEKGKEKHERQLRPRLGSPDAIDELLALDSKESERSNDLKENVEKFQSSLLSFTAKYSKVFCEDLAVVAAAYTRLLDTSLKLDLLQVPPDTEIPKKKVTMKRLRKAQRVKEAAKKGGEDLSVERVWPPLPLDSFLEGISRAEPYLRVEDLQEHAPAPVKQVEEEVPAKGKKKDAKKAEQPVEEAPPARPQLITDTWVATIRENSSVRGAVSTAHRLLVSERDAALERYARHMTTLIDENKIYYGKILQQEASWNDRWKGQVEMLKQGNL